jgi:ribosomal protein S10
MRLNDTHRTKKEASLQRKLDKQQNNFTSSVHQTTTTLRGEINDHQRQHHFSLQQQQQQHQQHLQQQQQQEQHSRYVTMSNYLNTSSNTSNASSSRDTSQSNRDADGFRADGSGVTAVGLGSNVWTGDRSSLATAGSRPSSRLIRGSASRKISTRIQQRLQQQHHQQQLEQEQEEFLHASNNDNDGGAFAATEQLQNNNSYIKIDHTRNAGRPSSASATATGRHVVAADGRQYHLGAAGSAAQPQENGNDAASAEFHKLMRPQSAHR